MVYNTIDGCSELSQVIDSKTIKLSITTAYLLRHTHYSQLVKDELQLRWFIFYCIRWTWTIAMVLVNFVIIIGFDGYIINRVDWNCNVNVITFIRCIKVRLNSRARLRTWLRPQPRPRCSNIFCILFILLKFLKKTDFTSNLVYNIFSILFFV